MAFPEILFSLLTWPFGVSKKMLFTASLPESFSFSSLSFSYAMVLEFIYEKEAEMWLRESDFLQRYDLDWKAYDQEKRVGTYYSR